MPGPVIDRDDKRLGLANVAAQLDEIGVPHAPLAPQRKQPLDIAHAQARHAQQRRALGSVDIDGERLAMRKCPCELRIDVEVELSSAKRRDDLVCAVTVVLKEPIGLIKTMLARQRRGLHGQFRRCVRNGTERRVIDAPQAIRRVQRFGGAQERRVG